MDAEEEEVAVCNSSAFGDLLLGPCFCERVLAFPVTVDDGVFV